MKSTLCIASLLLCASPALAQTTTPTFYMGVIDVGSAQKTQISQNTLSLSNPSHQLCWQATGLNPNTPRFIINEHITSPAPAVFKDNSARIESTGLNHQIVRGVISDGSGNLRRCWQFDKSDPIGSYRLSITIDDASTALVDWVFPAQYFYLTP